MNELIKMNFNLNIKGTIISIKIIVNIFFIKEFITPQVIVLLN